LGSEYTNVGDYDFIAADRSVYNELARALVESAGEWDVLNLDGLSPEAPLPALLEEALGPGRVMHGPTDLPSALVTLPRSWQEFREGRPDLRRQLKNIERTKRRIGELGTYRCDDIRDPEQAAQGMEDLFRLHRLGRARLGAGTVLDRPGKEDFHREVCRQMGKAGKTRLLISSVDSKPISGSWAVCDQGATFGKLHGFDPAWSALGPGQIIMAERIRVAIDDGSSSLDLMRGTEDYKWRWADHHRQDLKLVAGVTRRGRAFVAARRLNRRLRVKSPGFVPRV
jgi:CelD/BcsL family acetyltransferase involved in cellulose biosynthesis